MSILILEECMIDGSVARLVEYTNHEVGIQQ